MTRMRVLPRLIFAALAIAASATFLADGMIAGTWTIERARKAATLELAPFSPLPARVAKRLRDEADGMLRFLEPEATTLDVRLA